MARAKKFIRKKRVPKTFRGELKKAISGDGRTFKSKFKF